MPSAQRPAGAGGTIAPGTAAEAEAAVADALAAGAPLEILGNGSKRGVGRPAGNARPLSTARLAGVSLYEPEELVLRAGPGTPVDEIAALLDGHGQMLAFEPPDYGPLLGGAAGGATLGGVVAGNISGPRRLRSGAVRDHVLGVAAVSGRGELFRAGGRVVKNVTGYDLCKLMCGSWGTLGVLTEVTLKVLPAPERIRTVLVACSGAEAAVAAMTAALAGPHDPSAAAWLPEDMAARSRVSRVAGAGAGLAAVRLEGFGESVAARCAALGEALARFGDVAELHGRNSRAFWRELRDARFFDGDLGSDLWRVSVPPSEAPALHARARGELPARGWLDWGGGLVWLAVDGLSDAGASLLRAEAARRGGHATLFRADAARRLAVGPFQPEPEPLARLTRNIKDAFDPRRILNPGRMFEGA